MNREEVRTALEMLASETLADDAAYALFTHLVELVSAQQRVIEALVDQGIEQRQQLEELEERVDELVERSADLAERVELGNLRSR